jgi:FAD:protein FMN transferase
LIMKIKILLPVLVLCLTSCLQNSPKEFYIIDGFTQGTTYHLVYEAPATYRPEVVRKNVEAIFTEVDNSLSIYNDSSVISLINRNISNRTDSLFRDVFRLSYGVWKKSGGVFDITVGPLVRSWGFGPDAIRRFDKSKLDSLLSLVGMEKVSLRGQYLIKQSSGMFIDMNAIAQGYTVDLVIHYFKSIGVTDCLVEVGGEVRSSGNKNGAGWKVGIDKPVDGNVDPGQDMEAVITVNNRALATSGNYRKFYVDNGIKYSHTIDPRTGYPARHTLLSATILTADCATADAFATACMVIGKDSAIALIKKYDYLEGYLIWSDNAGKMVTWTSEGIRDLIKEK